MSTYRLVMQTIHKEGGRATTELIVHLLQQEVAHIFRYAVKRGLLVSPGHHGRNLNTYTLSRMGEAYVLGFAERRRHYRNGTPYPKQIYGYTWMAPLMPAPQAVEALEPPIPAAWFDVVSSERGTRVAEHANASQ